MSTTHKNYVYLAVPYTYTTPKRIGPLAWLSKAYNNPLGEYIKRDRFNKVNKIAAALFKNGIFVFSPVSHTRPIAQHGLPHDFEFYTEYDTIMLSNSTELLVLMLPGWRESKGVTEEIKIAKRLGLGIEYIRYEAKPGPHRKYIKQ